MKYLFENNFLIDGYSDVGNHRAENQDSIQFDESIGLVILADGMGGHKAGAVASKIATETLSQELKSYLLNTKIVKDTVKIQEYILSQILDTNQIIYQKSKSNDEESGMGTTLVINCFFDNKLLIAHVGDSRTYLYRNNELMQITKDHSFIQFQLDQGLITEEDFKNSKQKNYLTRALGLEEAIDVDFNMIELNPHDIVMSCSDGVTEKIDNLELEKFLENISTFDSPALALVEYAKELGSKDNISVVITTVLKKFTYEQPSFFKKIVKHIIFNN